ncbi:tRNA guanosine-2'-O-methyltransferase [Marchantia polymorpha subsp. ruderalis]|uniref:Subtilisin-like protease n=2 Tax=Marchantia polymorpha TaxID=3197 RepID=A0AAF6BRD5_MARPO|nr:hypothetical protein MARPO_0059s0076 [Marchantia polymorpha]BBN14569.1 hypothetical protein Mp_6g12710 [Marchantia polymorpha subsp. ruderalis]|eukprot:PTQ37150.1 hypothetical protein MARPO_0059s0076 [Marchantia polymorpha]
MNGKTGLRCLTRILWLQLCFLTLFSSFVVSDQVHIVYMGSHHAHLPHHEKTSIHRRMVTEVVGSVEASEDSILYHYKHLFSGFAAKLSPEQVEAMSKMDGVISLFESKTASIHTTRTWEFLGLEKASGPQSPDSLWAKTNYGEDVIVGVLDTGIWPEHESFHDDGMGPVPARWKGACEKGEGFDETNCNKKIIGARYYPLGFEVAVGPIDSVAAEDFRSPRDRDGHGTHTASTAAGRIVPMANVNGLGNGTAKGGAPNARIAVYKCCWAPDGGRGVACTDADMLAAFDAGIADGVDVFSVSLGPDTPQPFFLTGISIGAFHATMAGKVVAVSAGNSGPQLGTVVNSDPWSINVASTSIDRIFGTTVTLGNGVSFLGGSITVDNDSLDKNLPIVFGSDIIAAGANITGASFCLDGALDSAKTQGKVVVCLQGFIGRNRKAAVVKAAGGLAVLIPNFDSGGMDLYAENQVLPTITVADVDSNPLLDYVAPLQPRPKSAAMPTVKISRATTIDGVKPAPYMNSFSSLGPNLVAPYILKPDLAAPGLNIIAAWPGSTPPSNLPSSLDKRTSEWNTLSGTSMSCPHVAGVAALLKALHPTWSPAAIKSAMMTTARVTDNTGGEIKNSTNLPAGPLNYGAGNINPEAAADPGLIYESKFDDYKVFLCSNGYNKTERQWITGLFYDCALAGTNPSDLNQASVMIPNLEEGAPQTVKRTVTNVGKRMSNYKVSIVNPPGVKMTITPPSLSFHHTNQAKKFTIRFERVIAVPENEQQFVHGSFTWSDGVHKVSSPVVVAANFL